MLLMYILLRKHMWLLIFVLDMLWTCDFIDLYPYIFLMHVDALLWFHYVSLLIMLWNANVYVMYYYIVRVFFRHDYA